MPQNTVDLIPGGGPNQPGGLAQITSGGFYSTSTTGYAVQPAYSFSDDSLGFYQSAASTVALSYGTLSLPGTLSVTSLNVTGTTVFGSGISVGTSTNTGTLIPAISSLSSSVGVWVVQGSASSFTGIAWPAARVGDIILTGVLIGGGASSVSSGLVPWSHVTVAGQIEFRLSNVSTLVQNQSAQTWVFTRISPF